MIFSLATFFRGLTTKFLMMIAVAEKAAKNRDVADSVSDETVSSQQTAKGIKESALDKIWIREVDE
jgi:hypothetical protein